MSDNLLITEIFKISDLEGLRTFLFGKHDRNAIREQLYDCFLKYSKYSNAVEWNYAVRICEALAIVGWGKHEPLEAIRGQWFNGNPETYFIDRYSKPYFFDAVWSKRNGGFAIDYEMSFFHGNPENPPIKPIHINAPIVEAQKTQLYTQRNWIPKNPIRIIRGLANCYDNSKIIVESIDKELMQSLNQNMHPEAYGSGIDSITINLSFSFYDNYHCKTNYIIADEALKLKQKDFYPKLLELYSEKEIEDNGYYLRNRYTYGPFQKELGKIRINIVFEKEFSLLSESKQKQVLSEYLIHAVEQVAKRLKSKINYNFPIMISDFKSILYSWNNRQTF